MSAEAPRTFVSFAEEELDELVWQHSAPLIEQTSYLVKSDGSGCLDAVGKEVVLVKEGYFEQCKAVRQPQTDPRWTSVGLRRWQASWLSESMNTIQRGGIGYCRLGLVERCKVIGISYHRRHLPKAAETNTEEETGENGPELPGAGPSVASIAGHTSIGSTDFFPDLPTAQGQEQHKMSSEGEEDETSSDEGEDEILGQFFVRVRLQRLPQANDQLGPVCTIIDHYLDSGVGEFIIPRERFESTVSRRWKRGDRIQMYWADQASSGRGQWWEGTVLGYVKRALDDPFRDSPWAAVIIRWSETDSKDNISPWELSQPEDGFRADSHGSDVESDWDMAGAGDSSQDEDWELQHGIERPTRRSSRKRQGRSPCSGDSDSSYDFEPSRKRSKASSNVPETMQIRKSKGTVDWNKGHCVVCMAVPDGSLVVECDGTCRQSFHTRCLPEALRPDEDDEAGEPWFCSDCLQGLATCAACRLKGAAGHEVVKCKLGGCGNYFHPSCARTLAATNACLKIHRDSGEASSSSGRAQLHFTCPCHYCDRCHLSGDSLKIYRCWTCLKGVHGKCMDRTEKKLNEKEMECRDCAAAKNLAAGLQMGPSSSTGDVPVWQPGVPLAAPEQKVSKWTASLIDMKTRNKVDLVGKAIFHFGSHKKGGGCDFLIPVPNVKFHSELKILPDGNVILAYCHSKAREFAEIRVSKDGMTAGKALRRPEQLEHGETIEIAEARFRFELRPWEPSHTPLLLI